MVRTGLGVAALISVAAIVMAGPLALPPLALQDQESRRLELGDLRGRVVVIVYGTRARVDDHIAWGRGVDRALIARGAYRATTPSEQRPVRILALAQMGGVPSGLRGLVRTVVRQHVPEDFSLWLDWGDHMTALFGSGGAQSSVVVADRTGRVELVTSGAPTDAAVERVVASVVQLL
jgi:hypothetical protein